MPPARVAAPILLKARAASRLSIFSNKSEASSHRLANNRPKTAGINMNMASMGVLAPGSRNGAPHFHRFNVNQGQRQRGGADIDVDERQLEKAAIALEKQCVAAGFGNDEG